jgi:hypothetical protein
MLISPQYLSWFLLEPMAGFESISVRNSILESNESMHASSGLQRDMDRRI